MRAIVTTRNFTFAMLRVLRSWLNSDRVIIRDNARYVADGDWSMWQDEGECIG